MGKQPRRADSGPRAVNDPLICEAAIAAEALLRRSARPYGFDASASEDHYALWTRDMALSAMGANVSSDATLVAAVRNSLLTLQPMQAETGAIPNVAWPPDYWDWGEVGATDASALYTIATVEHLALHPDPALRDRLWPTLVRADAWLKCQDTNGFGLISSPNGHDWMESSFNRGGKVMFTNALYVRHVQGMADLAPDPDSRDALRERHALLVRKFNDFFWPHGDFNFGDMLQGVPYPRPGTITFGHSASPLAYRAAVRDDRGHYLSHVNFAQFVDECDVLGNVLAVLYDIAPPDRAKQIMSFLHAHGAADPFPARTYLRPLRNGDNARIYHKVQDRFQDPRWRNPPGSYHNGAIWPFIGGLYVSALQHVGMVDEAVASMRALAEAVRLSSNDEPFGFHEWIGLDGTPSTIRDQAWSAGTFLAAYHRLTAAGAAPASGSGPER